MNKIRLLCGGYILTILLLFLYSYTQVDLSLTLSRVSIYQYIEKSFQYIGYFQRPLSAELYIGLLLLLFGLYICFIRLAWINKLSQKTVWVLTIVTAVVLAFSYNAFSYDLFNYIFDAKIITHYHQNPYLHKALDYHQDPMLSFMQWTHRTYPYGPSWLAFTVPLSFVGMQYFLLTFFLFKICIALCYLGAAYYIDKILQKMSPKDITVGLVLFALNPLIIIESLVSAHNDILMIFLALGAIHYFLTHKYVRSFLLFILSVGVKFATGFLIIPLIYALISQKIYKKFNWDTFVYLCIAVMTVAVVVASFRSNFQPWYLLFVLPFAVLLGKKYFVAIPLVVLPFFVSLEYVPFLFLGNWNSPVPSILFWLTTSGIAFSIVLTALWKIKIALHSQKTVQ